MNEAQTYPPEGRFAQGPYVRAALLCETVLIEQNGVKSAIRIVDRIMLTATAPEPPTEMVAINYDFTLFLSFMSGTAQGPMRMDVRFVKPSGESPPPRTQMLMFEGERHRAVDVVVNLKLGLDQPGVYFLDVSLEGTRITRVPFQVIYMPQFTES